jgi:hypothetical protein
MQLMPNAVECKDKVCHEWDLELPKRPRQNRPGVLRMQNTWFFEDTIVICNCIYGKVALEYSV